MRMPTFCLTPALILAAAITVFADEPKIRELDLKTIENLGRELYQKDALAAEATDVLLETHPEVKQLKSAGWITLRQDQSARVFFLQKEGDRVSQTYIAVFSERGKAPTIEPHLGEKVPQEVELRLTARRTAIDAIPRLYNRPYNFEVLDDPDGSGFIVYALAATKDAHEVVVGGHYRVTVSADGSKAESVDALSKSLLILQKRDPNVPDGAEPVASVVSHIVSETPVETHVFLSLLHKKAFYVVTSEKNVWKVEEGSITKTRLEDSKEEAVQ